jgi:glycosyltransferase involved in cell wall biosynthesis
MISLELGRRFPRCSVVRFLMLNWRDPRNPLAGGAERVTLAYLAALVRRGHEAWWFSNDFSGASREETVSGVHIVRGGNRFTAWLAARRWCRSQLRFDLVLDQHHGLPWFAPWWCGTRCVSYIHEVLGPIWGSFYPWPISAVGRWQERWIHWLYRRVPFFTASQFTREELQRRGVHDVTIIPYGVETVALPELDEKPLADPLRLAAVSRLAPNKRVDHSLRVVRRLLDQGVKAELTIVGSGECESALKRLAAGLRLESHVRFAGALAEIEKDMVLRRAHFLLHTSLREGWGLNVIEANAMGTPAAVYPVAGLVESTLHGQTGFVAASETPEALAASLLTALRDPEDYQRWRQAAWQRAKEFHWNCVLPRACDWLEEQAGRK